MYNVIDSRQSYPQEIVRKGVAALIPELGEGASVHLSYEMVALSPAACIAPPPVTGMFIDLHSYNQVVLWPWAYSSTPARDAVALQTFGRRMAYFNGYKPEQFVRNGWIVTLGSFALKRARTARARAWHRSSPGCRAT